MPELIEIKGTRGTRTFVRPSAVDAINIQDNGQAFVYVHGESFHTLPEEAERLVEIINAVSDAFAVSPTEVKLSDQAAEDILKQVFASAKEQPVLPGDLPGVVDAHRLAHIERMTLDSFYSRTAGAPRRMWRCMTAEGWSFNIFDHVDHRNTYKLFQDAGFDIFMDEMKNGDSLDWSATPIEVYLQKNGDFYNPVKVKHPVDGDELRPVSVEADDGESEDDDG